MKNLIEQFTEYLKAALGLSVVPKRWQAASDLPFFLQDQYGFFTIRLMETDCLVLVEEGEELGPAATRKHIEQIEKTTGRPAIYVRARVASHNRKRLIDHRVPFVVPGNQMYLPPLGIDLREHYRTERTAGKPFSPSAQAVFIHCLRSTAAMLTRTEIAEVMDCYSGMTITRALDEIEAAQVGMYSTRDSERCWHIGRNREEIWERAQPYLKSPIRKRHFVVGLGTASAARSGLTALAHYSMLAPPPHTVIAVVRQEWKKLKHLNGVQIIPAPEAGATEIEIWSYDPQLFAGDGIVDPFSLYLTLRDTDDERVEAALEEMIEGLPWS